MIHTLFKDGAYMVIRQRIEYRPAVTAELDELCLLQNPELVRDGGHAHIQKRCNIAYAHFAFKKHIKYLYSCAVSENLVKLRKVIKQLLVGQNLIYL